MDYRDERQSFRGTTLFHDSHTLIGTINADPDNGGIRHDLLNFSQKLQGEFTTFLILFRIIQQLSEINLWILFLFIAFHRKYCIKLSNHIIHLSNDYNFFTRMSIRNCIIT